MNAANSLNEPNENAGYRKQGNSMEKSRLVGLGLIVGLSALALGVAHRYSIEAPALQLGPFALSSDLDRSGVTLADGRVLALRDSKLDLAGKSIALSAVRRFASLTVMPTGQVLIWGGIDEEGRLLETGEWFEPSTGALVTTGRLGLPPRAGHTLNVLSDGTLAMTGGWGIGNVPAHEVALWRPLDRRLELVAGDQAHTRLKSSATLSADGTLKISGGVDEIGRPVHEGWKFGQPDRAHASEGVVASYPTKDTTGASPIGPLALRFADPVDVAQLGGTVSLLGPNGVVKTRVIGAEDGRLAFVQLPDELYPAARYTIFVQGLHTAKGEAVPYEAIGFTTKAARSGVVLAGEGKRPGTPGAESDAPPLFVMAGEGKAKPCKPTDAFHLCRDKGLVKDGAFYPGQDNVATSSGGHWRLYKDRQTLPDTKQLEGNLPKGATALIGQVRQIDETPVADVEISVDGQKVRTDGQGVFVVQNLLPGRRELFVDGRPAGSADTEYGRFVVGADVTATTVNHMPFVMYLPRVLARDKIALPSPTTRETVLTHPDMPGLELRIPAGAVFKDRDGKVLNEIAIVPTPVDHAPFPLPDNFPMYFTIQPGDAVVQGMTPEAAKGIQVVYPNYGKQKPADKADFWVYSAEKGWEMYGAGHVSANASQLVADNDTRLVWALGAGASTNPPQTSNDMAPDNKCAGDPVDLQTGLFFRRWSDLSVNDTMPLVVDRTANSIPDMGSPFGLGSGTSLRMTLSSSDGFQTPKIVLSCGEVLQFDLVAGAATWPLVGTVWQHRRTRSAFYGATLQFLTDATPEGAHWVVTMKDGSQIWFDRHVPNHLARRIDRFGNTVNYVYNGGFLVGMVSPNGRTIGFTYNTKNMISTAFDHTGRTVQYAYRSIGEGLDIHGSVLTSVTYPDGTSEHYTYSKVTKGGANLETWMIESIVDRRGNTAVKNEFDEFGSIVLKQTYADGSTTTFDYERVDGRIQAATVTDGEGNKERTEFDPVSRYPSSEVRAYGTENAQTTTYNRNAAGLLLGVTDPTGRETTFTYDQLGNLTSVTRLAGTAEALTSRYTFAANDDRVTSMTDPLGRTTRMTYENGCLSSIANPLNQIVRTTCNGQGQVVQRVDALGNEYIYRYSGGDLTEATDALGRTTRFTVDSLGRRVSATTPDGSATLTTYDTNDRITQTIDPLGRSMSLKYDENGNLTDLTLSNGAVTRYEYDVMNRLVTRYDSVGRADHRTYTALGQLYTFEDRRGQTSTFAYDELSRLVQTTYGDGSTTQVSYDSAGRPVHMLDSISGALDWTYDSLDRMLSETSPLGTVRFTYDLAGQRLSRTAPDGSDTRYGYDDAGRTTSIAQGTKNFELTYDDSGRRTGLELPNGTRASYSYDEAGELIRLSWKDAENLLLSDSSYTYDLGGRRTSEAFGASMDRTSLSNPTLADATFDAGNHVIAADNREYLYDENGNLIADGSRLYQWDARNRLTRVSQSDGTFLSFKYDALGRRVEKTRGTAAPTSYIYDGNSMLMQLQDGAITDFLDGPRIDEHLAKIEDLASYFVVDGLQSVVGVTNESGVMTARTSYDAFGASSDDGVASPFGYTGRERDLDDLYYYRARYFSTSQRRFLSEDPISFNGGDQNLYAYVGGNPLSYIDPYGLWAWGDPLPQGFVDGATGFGDGVYSGITFGLGNLQDVRDLAGIDGGVDLCSAAYRYSHIAGEIEGAVALGGALASKSFVPGGWANSNRYLRLGYGRNGGDKVFRAAGQWVKRVTGDAHVDFWTAGKW